MRNPAIRAKAIPPSKTMMGRRASRVPPSSPFGVATIVMAEFPNGTMTEAELAPAGSRSGRSPEQVRRLFGCPEVYGVVQLRER